MATTNTSSASELLLVSIPEACRIIGIRRSTLYRELRAGRIKALKSGKRTLIPVESLRAWRNGLSVYPSVGR